MTVKKVNIHASAVGKLMSKSLSLMLLLLNAFIIANIMQFTAM